MGKYTDKYNEAMEPENHGWRGWVQVATKNLHTLSMMLHASAMRAMNIVSEREELLFLGCAYQGESGELGNVLKKIARDGKSPELMKKLEGEIADNYLYLLHVCDLFGVDATSAMVAKTSELYNYRQPEWAKEAIIAAGGAYLRVGDEEEVERPEDE